MSFSRIAKLLNATPPHYQPILEDKTGFSAHKEQQLKILEHYKNKLSQGESAFNNLESEMKAIYDQTAIREHIRINDIFFCSGNAASLQVAQDEMEQHPALLQGYVNFHRYLENANAYKEEVEKCLAMKPGIKDGTIQELHKKLNKQYQDFKKAHKLNETLAEYMHYDKKVNEIITHCNSHPNRRLSLR